MNGADAASELDAFCRRWEHAVMYRFLFVWQFAEQDARDLTQEVFAGLTQAWPTLVSDEHRQRVMWTIARRRARDFLRDAPRWVVAFDDLSHAARRAAEPLAADTAELVVGDGRHERLHVAVRSLSARHRTAVLGRVVYDMDYDELQLLTGRNRPALRQDVARGLTYLRNALRVAGALLLGAVMRSRRGAAQVAVAGGSVASHVVLVALALTVALAQRPLDVAEAAPSQLGRDVAAVPAMTVQSTEPSSGAERLRVVDRARAMTAPAPVPPRRSLFAPHVRTRKPPRKPTTGVCVGRGCKETITVRVGGRRHSVGQSHAEVCWAVPMALSPNVACSKTGERT